MEFVATFTAVPFQHVGFVADMSFNSPWAIFSTSSAGNGVYMRASGGAQTLISAALLNSPHLYRLDWNATTFVFYVDGVQVGTITQTVASNMLALASDNNVGGGTLTLDWLRVRPYASAGSFTSRIYDGGGPTSWVTASWNATLPSGTSVALSVRGGDVSTPDGTWTSFQPVATSGGSVGLCARYVQYQANLSTSDTRVTPALQDVALTCAPPAGAGSTITSLAVAPGTGNDTSGNLKLRLTWTGGATGATQIYRKGFGDYPLFRTGVGSQPTAPATPAAAVAQGWTLTGVSTTGQTDQPPSRDYWYYVGFQLDACGHSSAPSGLAQIPGYVLGDVSNGLALCQGDNVVNSADLSLLGAHYGATLSGAGDPLSCVDVGPTTDFSTRGRPQPDHVLDFEDFVMYALDWTGAAGPAGVTIARSTPAATSVNALSLDVPSLPGIGGTFDVGLKASGAGNVQALSVALDFDASVVEQLGVESGELLGRQGVPSAVLTPKDGRLDAALLGDGGVLRGEGELVRVSFRVKAVGDPAFGVRVLAARDGENHKVAWGTVAGPVREAKPARTELGSAYPNPFTRQASLQLSLAQPGTVHVVIYDLAGRRVRTLLDGAQPAGRTTLVWDGRSDGGTQLGSGYYVVKMEAGQVVQKRSVLLLR
jgi:flagellar hook capping protein FlgD/cohesin domain-containing protein